MPGLQPAALGALAAGDGVLFAGGPGLGPGGGGLTAVSRCCRSSCGWLRAC